MKSTDPGFSDLTFQDQLQVLMEEMFQPSFTGATKLEKELDYLRTRTLGIPRKDLRYPIHGICNHWIATKSKCNRTGVTNNKKSRFEYIVDENFVEVRKFLTFHLCNFPILALDELSLYILAIAEKRKILQEAIFDTLLRLRALFAKFTYPRLDDDKDRSRKIVEDHILQYEHLLAKFCDFSQLNAEWRLYPDNDPIFYEMEMGELLLFTVYSHVYTQDIVFCPLIPRELHANHGFKLWQWDFLVC
jgi:hypothetical protein